MSQTCEEATPGGLADLIGGAFSLTQEQEESGIPLLEEQVHITKREVVSDRVRVTTIIEERAVLVEDEIERGDLRVERVAVDRLVDKAPPPRREGDTLIVSVVEERLVVEKRLFVVEEVRIVTTSSIERVAIPDTIRVMHATVERTNPSPSSTGRDSDG